MGYFNYLGAGNYLPVFRNLRTGRNCMVQRTLPDFSNGISVPSVMPTFMQMDFAMVFTGDFLIIMFAFLFVDMFDTLGTLIGVASKAERPDKNGQLPRIRGALLADAVGTSSRRSTGNLLRHYASGARKLCRRIRRRTYSTYQPGNSSVIPGVPVPVPDFPCHSVLCNSSGAGNRRIYDADFYCEN